MFDFIIFIGRINYKYYMEDLFMSKYYSINKFSKILGVSAQTLEYLKIKWTRCLFFIKTEQQELVEDLVQIITEFSCKLQGKRANKARKLVKELIDDGGEEDDKNNPIGTYHHFYSFLFLFLTPSYKRIWQYRLKH